MTATIDEIEHAGYTLWSPDESVEIGGWTVRSSGGFTRRLNSATAVGVADTSGVTRDAIAGWLADRGADLAVRVTPLIDPATVRDCASGWGLAPRDETFVLARTPTASIGGRDVEVVPADHAGFTSELLSLNDRSTTDAGPWSRIVGRLGSDAVGLWIPGTAVALIGVDGDTAAVFSLAVAPEHRRRGVATRVMNAAFTWTARRGAGTLFVQVLGANGAALGLYGRLGFTEVYRYHYLQP